MVLQLMCSKNTVVIRNGTATAMDLDDVVGVTRAINGGENALEQRTKFTNRMKRILL